MKTYGNTIELINDLPKFMIPSKSYDLYWYIKIQNSPEYIEIMSKKKVNFLKEKFGDIQNNKSNVFNEEIDALEKNLKLNSKFKFLRNNKIIFYNEEIPENMTRCNECGKLLNLNRKCCECNILCDLV